jgi:hypothetical protein
MQKKNLIEEKKHVKIIEHKKLNFTLLHLVQAVQAVQAV